MTTLGEIDHFRHSRRLAHSHAATSPGFLLSLTRQSCVQKLTERKREHAYRALIFFSSIRRCSRSGTSGNSPYFYRSELSATLTHLARSSLFLEYTSPRCDQVASSCALDTYASSASAAVAREQRESDCSYQRGRRDRNQQNHLFSSSLVSVVWGRVSWVQYLRRSVRRLSKAIARMSSLPNNRSVKSHRYFLQSQECFGPPRLPRIWQPRPIVRFVQPSSISLAIANGPATPSPQSSPKSSGATPCGTSRSFPNGQRRPF